MTVVFSADKSNGLSRAGSTAGLVDPFGRRIDYLRVSVTDRCDLRCVYCMSERQTFLPRSELLTIEELEKKMRKAASDLEFEEAGRLRDEIRQLEQEELGLPVDQHKAPVMGRSNEGKPGTRKTRFGKTQRKFGGARGAR